MLEDLVFVSIFSLLFGVPALVIFYLIARSSPGNQNINSFSIQGMFKLLAEIVGLYLLFCSIYLAVVTVLALPGIQGTEGFSAVFLLGGDVVAFIVTILMTVISFRLKIGPKDTNINQG